MEEIGISIAKETTAFKVFDFFDRIFFIVLMI